jgi:hypothetical protein
MSPSYGSRSRFAPSNSTSLPSRVGLSALRGSVVTGVNVSVISSLV